MKKVNYLFLILLFPLVVSAGGNEKQTYKNPPQAPKPVTEVQPPVVPQTHTDTPAPVVAPVNGGGWGGGCSTYATGQLPPWGKVPCVPTNPSQGAPVTPESLRKPPITSLPLSSLPSTGYDPSKDLAISFVVALGLTMLLAKYCTHRTQ